MNSTWRRSLESPKERSERCLSGGIVTVVPSWGSRWFRNAKYSWRIRESPMKTKWLCFPQNARYLRHRLVSLKHYTVSFLVFFVHVRLHVMWKTFMFYPQFLRLAVMVHHTAIRLPLLVSFVPAVWQKPFAWIYSYEPNNNLINVVNAKSQFIWG